MDAAGVAAAVVEGGDAAAVAVGASVVVAVVVVVVVVAVAAAVHDGTVGDDERVDSSAAEDVEATGFRGGAERAPESLDYKS